MKIRFWSVLGVLWLFLGIFLFSEDFSDCPQWIGDYYKELNWGENYSNKEIFLELKEKYLKKLLSLEGISPEKWYRCFLDLERFYVEALKDGINFSTRQERSLIIKEILTMFFLYGKTKIERFPDKYFYLWLEKIKALFELLAFYKEEKKKDLVLVTQRRIELYADLLKSFFSDKKSDLQEFLFHLWSKYKLKDERKYLEEFEFIWEELFPFSNSEDIMAFSLRDPRLWKYLSYKYGSNWEKFLLKKQPIEAERK